MRTVLVVIFLIAVVIGLGAFQSEVRQVPPLRFEPPSVVGTVDVVYPPQSVASGTVVLEVSLDEDGKIIGIRVVQGIASLTEPAEYSVQQWKFHGAKFEGKPVPSKITTAFSFVPPSVGPRW
jgi:outer membrane biosynthesis protein TonB